jgi:hypothetical protein
LTLRSKVKMDAQLSGLIRFTSAGEWTVFAKEARTATSSYFQPDTGLKVIVKPSLTSAANSKAIFIQEAAEGTIFSITIQPFDSFDNPTVFDEDSFIIMIGNRRSQKQNLVRELYFDPRTNTERVKFVFKRKWKILDRLYFSAKILEVTMSQTLHSQLMYIH